jgi:hypothetical protein
MLTENHTELKHSCASSENPVIVVGCEVMAGNDRWIVFTVEVAEKRGSE